MGQEEVTRELNWRDSTTAIESSSGGFARCNYEIYWPLIDSSTDPLLPICVL